VFRVHDIDVKVGTLKFAIRDSKHDFLYKTLRPLATALVKRQIQKAIKDALRTGLEYLDGQLVAVRDRMAEAKTQEGQGRIETLKEVGSMFIITFASLLTPKLHLAFPTPTKEGRSFDQDVRYYTIAFQSGNKQEKLYPRFTGTSCRLG